MAVQCVHEWQVIRENNTETQEACLACEATCSRSKATKQITGYDLFGQERKKAAALRLDS